MHQHLLAFVDSAAEAFTLEGPAYEFGVSSVDVNGGGIGHRDSCSPASYVDCESSAQTCTSRLDDMTRLPFPDGAARTVICIDAIQYVADPVRTAEEMARVLAPGGMLILGSSIDPDAPDPPGRFWRPTHEMLAVMMSGLEATLIGWQGPQRRAHTLFGIGAKPPVSESFAPRANLFLADFQNRLERLAVRHRRQPVLRTLTSLCTLGKRAKHKPADYFQSSFVLHLPVGREFKHELLSTCLPDQQKGTRIDLGG